MPNLPYSSAAWSNHHEVGQPRIEYPFPVDLTGLLITRTYEGPRSTYSAPAFGTLDAQYNSNSNLANAYLVELGPLEPLDGGQVRYTRTFATVPANRTEYSDYTFRYPGIDSISIPARDPFTVTVLMRIDYSYEYTLTPGSIILDNPFVYPDNYLTDASDPTASEYMSYFDLTMESTLRRLYGNIWERVTKTIPLL